MSRIIPVILSGGSGTRLWPVSRAALPKQFQAFVGQHTLLQDTVLRVAGDAHFAAPIIVGSAAHAALIEEQLAEVGLGADMLILEPCGRNTALAIALAAHAAGGGQALLLVLPSDHAIRDEAAFHAAVQRGAPSAADGKLVTFGVTPDRAETGYGYIERGEETTPGVHDVACFVEKPDRATAETFLAEGRHDWNAGIFLFRAATLLAALDKHAPDVARAAHDAFERATRDGDRLSPAAEAFASAPSRSIDHAVMEHARGIAVVPVAMGWSDVGGWDALYEIGAKDEAGNVIDGHVEAGDSRNCLIRSEGPLIVARGVQDLIVVATGDAVLILPRGEGQQAREAVASVQAREDPRL